MRFSVLENQGDENGVYQKLVQNTTIQFSIAPVMYMYPFLALLIIDDSGFNTRDAPEFQLDCTKVFVCFELMNNTHRSYGLDLSKSTNLIEKSKQYFKKSI